MTSYIGGLAVAETGELLVADQAVHPGEDAIFDRTYGGRMPASKSALTASDAIGTTAATTAPGANMTSAMTATTITHSNHTAAATTLIHVIPTSTTGRLYKEWRIP